MDDDADTRSRDRTRDALLVARLRAGDERAFGEIYDAWYDRVHDLARRIVRDDGRAADVAQDTFLNAWRRIDTLSDPASLGGWLLRIARNRALNVVEKEARSVAVDDESMHRIEAGGPTVSAPDGFRVADLAHRGDPARVVEDDEVAALLWEAADALGERDRTVLDLQLRHGLTPAEIGEVVGVNRNAANQLVHRVKGRLESAVQARVLWRGSAPSCEVLRAALAAAGVDTFDSRAVTITNNHASTCEECGERRHLRLQPTALFGALPIVVAPIALKQQAAAALAADGVPMHGSVVADGTPGAGSTGSTAGGTPESGSPGAAVVGPSTAGVVEEGASRAGGRRTAVAVAAVLALLALAAGVGLAVGGDDADGEEVRSGPTVDADDDLASAPSSSTEPVRTSTTNGDTTTGPTTTTTTSSTTTSTTMPTSPANGPPGGGDPPLVVPPSSPGTSAPAATPTTATPAAPTTTTTPAPSATASIRISPSSVSDTYQESAAPRLTWSASGGATVVVSGPGFSSNARSGDEPVCPTDTAPWSICVPFAAAPSARYQIRVYDAGGNVLVSRSAFLTVS